MHWLDLIVWFVGGAVLVNAVPHLAAGLSGRPFQTPFADPPGKGLSSATLNVLWGFANLALAYCLICRVGAFDLHDTTDVAALGLGMLLLGLFCARHFGRLHGGVKAERP